MPRLTPGRDHWAIKTLADPDAASVDLTPRPATVAQLRALPAPLHPPAGRLAAERVCYRLAAILLGAKEEDDGDVHLVIADPSDHTATMIAEIPNPAFLAAGNPALPHVTAARAACCAACGRLHLGKLEAFALPVELTGVCFFDHVHGQDGVAPNGIELHPVLSFATDIKGDR